MEHSPSMYSLGSVPFTGRKAVLGKKYYFAYSLLFLMKVLLFIWESLISKKNIKRPQFFEKFIQYILNIFTHSQLPL